jgi:hypothetical protein
MEITKANPMRKADILHLRAKDQSKIEKVLQVPEVKELVTTLSSVTERAGFEPAVPQGTHRFSKPAP